jgi:hypothetical protein
VNFNSLEQCSNTREFSTRLLLCPAGSLAWASDRGGLAGFSPAHMGRTGSDSNLNALTRVRPKSKCIEPSELINGILFCLCEQCSLNRVRPKKNLIFLKLCFTRKTNV